MQPHDADPYERTADPELQGELAAEALVDVERQLQLTREQRRQLDSTEAKLWARQNRLEGILIQTRGSAWWRERRNAARTEATRSNGHGPASMTAATGNDAA